MRNLVKRTMAAAGMLLVLFALLFVAGGRQVLAKSIKLNKTTVYMAPGDTFQLKVTGTSKKITWTSSNKKVATVSSKGLVKAKKTGKATITAKAAGKKLSCKVIVEKKTVNRARILRDYVLKKGKKDSKSGQFVMKKLYLDKANQIRYLSITASKKNQQLIFFRSCTDTKKTSNNWSESYTLTIDLISGQSAVKKGKCICIYQYNNAYGEIGYSKEEAVVTTELFRDSEEKVFKGIKLTKTVNYEPNLGTPESGDYIYVTITDEDQMDLDTALSNVAWHSTNAINDMNDWFKSVKELKKYGISMKAIGFTKWR